MELSEAVCAVVMGMWRLFYHFLRRKKSKIMSRRENKHKFSAQEAIDMIMHDPDSGDSDLDLGEGLSDDGWQTNSDLEVAFEDLNIQNESYNEEVTDNAVNIAVTRSTPSTTSATPTSSSATPTSNPGRLYSFFVTLFITYAIYIINIIKIKDITAVLNYKLNYIYIFVYYVGIEETAWA